jgi:probable O-glycosylation ligase (exosortase A-associated)
VKSAAVPVGYGTLIALTVGLAWAFLPHPIIGPALAILPLLAILSLNHPFILAFAFVIFSFFRMHEVFPVLIPLKLPLVLALGTLVSLAWSIAFGRVKPFWHSLFMPFLALFVAVSVGIIFASNTGNSLAYWKETYVKIGLMVFVIPWALNKEPEIRLGTLFILAAAGIVAAVTLSNQLQGIGLVEGTRVTIGREIGSVLGDPNDLSLVLLFGASFAGAAATGRGLPTIDRVLGAAVLLAVAAAIVATQSRGGLLGLTAVIGIFVSERIRSKLTLGCLALVALVVLFAISGIDNRQSGGAHETGIDESAMGRLHAWGAAIRMALANPMTGVGLDNFYFNYFFYSDFWDGKNHAVHSTWFEVLGETGIMGLALFIWMVAAIYFGIRATKRLIGKQSDPPPILLTSVRGLMGGLVGFCVSGTFLTQAFTWPLYIILGLTVATNRIAGMHHPAPSEDAEA